MNLSEIGTVHIFRLPVAMSLLATIRQQLWAVIDRSPAITNLATTDLISCKRINQQPVTYLSAVAHQLVNSIDPAWSQTYLSPVAGGDYLLKHLAAVAWAEPTVQWQGAVNNQGYLYLQPMPEAIASWLNYLFNNKSLKINSCSLPAVTASPVTLQYVYTRCTQLLDLAQQTLLTSPKITTTDFATPLTISPELELISAILDIWDQAAINISGNQRRILLLSRCLIERFLELEKTCHFGNHKNQITTSLDYNLLAIVQTTVKMILKIYWNLESVGYW